MHPFRNPHEGRLRAGWRLLLQTLLFFALTLALGGGLVLLGVTGMAAGYTAQVVGAIASVALAGRFLDRRPFAGFGLHVGRRWWRDFAFGAGLGVVLMAAIFGVEVGAGWVTVEDTFVSTWPGVPFAVGFLGLAAFFAVVAYYEELLARGYHLLNLAEGFRWLGRRAALGIAWAGSSAVFGIAHAANPNATLVSTVGVALAGLLLGLGWLRTGELGLPIGLHLTWNLAQGGLFGFPVSGQPSPARALAIEQGGPDLWTGGPFGPEAGLVGVLAMTAGAAAILWYTRGRGPVEVGGRFEPPAPDQPTLTSPEARRVSSGR